MAKQLLVVEDEKDISNMMVHHLRTAGFKVQAAYDGETALEKLAELKFDLVVLDVLLPGMNGWELCENIRSRDNGTATPIIIVSALTSEGDRIKGFDLGCDDYLMKPFSPREMVSRVNAVLRRSEANGVERTSLKIGDLKIDFLKHQVYVRGRHVHLTSTEFQLLNLLARQEGRVYSREQLLNMMRENHYDLELGNIDVHVHNLRRKIETDPKKPEIIETVWGVGYRFVDPSI